MILRRSSSPVAQDLSRVRNPTAAQQALILKLEAEQRALEALPSLSLPHVYERAPYSVGDVRVVREDGVVSVRYQRKTYMRVASDGYARWLRTPDARVLAALT